MSERKDNLNCLTLFMQRQKDTLKRSLLYTTMTIHTEQKTINISERKSGTERTKKRKKRELVFYQSPGAQLIL